jgi:MscS family membrane protein
MRLLLAAIAALSLLLAAPAPALATRSGDPPAASAPARPAPAEEVAPDSPRASVKRFLELCRAGEYAEAAGYLDLSDAQKPEGAQLARRLKAVLDRELFGKIESISPKSYGDPNDHLPAGVEEVGQVPGPSGPEPVRLVHRYFPDGARWIFSRNTVEHIDDWFGRLRDRWQQQYLPERLLRPGPKDVLWWQWIALPVLFAAALAAGAVLGWATRLFLGRLTARTKNELDDALLVNLNAPITFLWALACVYFALPHLALYPPAEAFIVRLVRAGVFVAVLWIVARTVDVVRARLLESPNAKDNPAARSLVPLVAKVLKVTLVIIALIIALSELGIAVGSLVAGLGIGGVALALAAQKTVENLFGSLSIGVDQPFRVGDLVTVDGITGTVETIGLRSTRIRTLDRTLVTFPNGKLADMRIETFAARDRIKLGCTLPLAQGTRLAAVRVILTDLRALLGENPKIWPDVTVALTRVTDTALEIEVLCWFQTTTWSEYVVLREEALLGMLEVIERAGAKLAVPMRQLRMES